VKGIRPGGLALLRSLRRITLGISRSYAHTVALILHSQRYLEIQTFSLMNGQLWRQVQHPNSPISRHGDIGKTRASCFGKYGSYILEMDCSMEV
jgi:hypothetical protein